MTTPRSKQDRLDEFIRRLLAAPTARTYAEARHQVADILTAVEDELTDIPNDPRAGPSDGRMYPPRDDSERASPNRAWRRFRSAAHNTLVGTNGAIRILEVARPPDDWAVGAVILDKPGADGRRIEDLEARGD